jgi:Na+/H+ antiporter NhaC
MDWKAAVSFVPFTLFVGTAIGLSFWGAIDINLLVGVGISAILVGTFLTKEKGTYWETVFEFLGSKTAMTATLLWLIVGVYGSILKEGHIVDGLVWAAHQFDINATWFTLVVFLFSGLFAISTGSGFGTISAMSLTLFPAGIALGADPALLGGAILSGAALGDSIAPVSDTAVIAATTQEYADGKGSADIGGTVKKRLPLVLTALAVALIAYGMANGNYTTPSQAISNSSSTHPQGLALLIPTLVVILLSFRKVNIFVSLALGLAIAVGIGLAFDLFTLSSLINMTGGKVEGAIVERFGKHRHPVYQNVELPQNNGVTLAVKRGTQARAVFNGTVSQIVVLPGYNQCVLVNHGAYYTLYSKLATVAVKPGEKVKTGQIVGTVDTIGGEDLFHFELWNGTTPQNPENWLRD